jgi:hypothetical protein
MRKQILRSSFFILHLIILCACSSSTPEEQAARAARAYYQHLIDDRPAEFLQGKADADSLPDSYRAQLLMAINQYRADMLDKHNGLREVQVSENVGRRDTSLHLTYAFLLLCYGDSTQEEITVPMVERDGQWLMK